MIVTDNHAYAEKVQHLTTQAKTDSLFYIYGEIGYNYRMPNIAAAIGLAQLEQLPEIVSKKHKLVPLGLKS